MVIHDGGNWPADDCSAGGRGDDARDVELAASCSPGIFEDANLNIKGEFETIGSSLKFEFRC